ncbi:hypothetical protein NIES4103_56530 [Nostoc sp. NIES-4103]|nr:hypothetical protein NIES4103_56530 [Nostoc sp. NIES-4103]
MNIPKKIMFHMKFFLELNQFLQDSCENSTLMYEVAKAGCIRDKMPHTDLESKSESILLNRA